MDLSGSTAFKNSSAGNVRGTGALPQWVLLFEQFYQDFPNRFSTRFHIEKNENVGTDSCPMLWKAVGDELVFCGKVTSKRSVATALKAFIYTLHDYRSYLMAKPDVTLNLKGSAFIAAFPEPNRAVKVRPGDSNDGPLMMSASEALESAADENPFGYDFFGKAVDTGFRIAANSRPDRFTLSVQLARLLAETEEGFGFDHPIHLDHPREMKGVNNGEAYPILFIETARHLPMAKVRELSRPLLNLPEAPKRRALAEYLRHYCEAVGTEEIILSYDASLQPSKPPASFEEHRVKIEQHLATENERPSTDSISEDVDETGETGASIPEFEPLKPLPKNSDDTD